MPLNARRVGHPFRWIMFTALLVLAGISYTVGTFWWTVAGAFFAAAAAIFAFFAWRVEHSERQDRLKREKLERHLGQELAQKRDRLFTIEHQPTPDDHFTKYASREVGSHYMSLTARMALDTQVVFVSLRFDGEGQRPKIKALDDWQFPQRGRRPHNVVRPYEMTTGDGRTVWYWAYNSPHYRLEDSRITIGVQFEAEAPFVGDLHVAITTTSDGAKTHAFPVRIGVRR